MESPSPHRLALELGFQDEEILPYGRDKVKLHLGALERLSGRPQGRLIVVTAITPTPAGEGKTVTSLGLADGLRRIGLRASVCIREPSLGPTFGMKGGAAGGGRAQAVPAADLNLHFTGDFHAVTAAHNLLAAMVEAHIHHGNSAEFEVHGVLWNRVLDVTDRSLRQVVTGLGGKSNGLPRETGFDITAASEVMALLSLTDSLSDLKRRLGEIVVGVTGDGRPIRARDLQAAGAMAALLRDAAMPNLIRTLEGAPVFVHTGPFGNLATGCNSLLADRMALSTSDFVVTEAGFAADLGFEKFCHIVAPALGRGPDAAVVVATIRGLKAHSGRYRITPGKPLPADLGEENLDALREGAENLRAHLRIVHGFGAPAVVAINRFPTDTDGEIGLLRACAREFGADAVEVSDAYARGSEGSAALAEEVARVSTSGCARFTPLYRPEMPLLSKMQTVATQVYGGDGIKLGPGVKTRLRQYEAWGYGGLPVCFAKTQYSLSHDPSLLGAPSGFVVPIERVQLAAGAGFVRALCGEIMTMPGMPAAPAAHRIDLDESGEITGVI